MAFIGYQAVLAVVDEDSTTFKSPDSDVSIVYQTFLQALDAAFDIAKEEEFDLETCTYQWQMEKDFEAFILMNEHNTHFSGWVIISNDEKHATTGNCVYIRRVNLYKRVDSDSYPSIREVEEMLKVRKDKQEEDE